MKVYCPICGILVSDIERNQKRTQIPKDVIASCGNGHEFVYKFPQNGDIAKTMHVTYESPMSPTGRSSRLSDSVQGQT